MFKISDIKVYVYGIIPYLTSLHINKTLNLLFSLNTMQQYSDDETSYGKWDKYTKKSRMSEYADKYVEIILTSPIYWRVKENEERLVRELEEKATMVRFLMAENEKLRRKYKQAKKQKKHECGVGTGTHYAPIYPEEDRSADCFDTETYSDIEIVGKAISDFVPKVVIKTEPDTIKTDIEIDTSTTDKDVVIIQNPIHYEVVEIKQEETEEVEVEVEVEEETEEVEVEVEGEEETEEVEVEVEGEEETEEVEVKVEGEEETEEVEVEVEGEEETEEVEVEVEGEEETEEVEEEGVYEISIEGKRYYTTNEVNGTIYELLEDEDVGEEIGKFVNKQVIWNN